MKINEIKDKDLKEKVITDIAGHLKDRVEGVRYHSNQASRWLLLMNSGGAIATLTFIGNVDTIDFKFAFYTLLGFVIGIAFMVIYGIQEYFRLYTEMLSYYDVGQNCLDSKISLEKEAEERTNISKIGKWVFITPALSLVCLFGAFSMGLLSIYCVVISST